jgi:arylsulfatase A-like enzyme
MQLDGQNIWPLLTGRETHSKPRTFYWKTPQELAVRHGNWKLIVNRKPPAKGELFNLAEDPNEKQNLAARFPDRVAKLRQLLAQQQELDP